MRLGRFTSALIAVVFLVVAGPWTPALAGPTLVFDVNSGKVLSHEDAFRRWYPASLTKLMTAYVAFRAVKAGELAFDSPVRMSEHAAGEPPSKMGFRPGSVLTLDNALKIIMVKSANDVATAIAENVGGSERAFVERMNAEAARLGMSDTRFANANGLPSTDQFTTARDMALLVRALRGEFRPHARYFSIEAIDSGGRVMRNYNPLIGRFEGADGMKTGYICASGFNLIASATRGNRTIAAVVLGALSQSARAETAAELVAEGFRKNGFLAPSLDGLNPYGAERHVATDMRPRICTAAARSARAENRDAQGRPIISSPYLSEPDRPPRTVVVGLGGADGPASTVPRYADVPIPTPRPDYPPAEAIAADDGG